jgi:hypothetical protein
MNSSAHVFTLLAASSMAAAAPAAAYEGDGPVRARAAVVRAPGPGDDASHTFEIRTDDGKVTVRVDGKEIPTDRLRVEGGRVIVLDEDGKEIKGIGLFAAGPGGLTLLERAHAEAEVQAQPPVMLGIHMSDTDEALQRHLRLAPGETAIISSLYEGLPAQKAGIEQYDIIVAVDGKRPAGPKQVREALGGLEDGDAITFTVIHEGRTVDRTVTVEAWDSERMQAATLIGAVDITTPEGHVHWPGLDKLGKVWGPGGESWITWLDQAAQSQELQKLLKEHLHDQLPPDIDTRLEHLNQRVDEIKELIDRLILQARDLARESQEKR